MKIEILSLCDFAQTDPAGKLTILGAFDRLHAPEAPIQRTVCAVAARIRFEPQEEGVRTVSIAFVDSDGQRVLPVLRAQLPVKIQPAETSIVLNYVMVIPQMRFPRFGDYQVDLGVDGKVEASIPLLVRQRTQPTPGT